MQMHQSEWLQRRARRLAERNNTSPNAAGPDEDDKREMDNFQDLQLGSITPLVRLEKGFPSIFLV